MYGDREELAMWRSLQPGDADNDESEALPIASVSTNCDISVRDPAAVGEIKNRDTGYRFSENAGCIVGNGITSA